MVETITPVVHGGRAPWRGTSVLHAPGPLRCPEPPTLAWSAPCSGLRGTPACWGSEPSPRVALGELTPLRVPVPQLRRQVPTGGGRSSAGAWCRLSTGRDSGRASSRTSRTGAAPSSWRSRRSRAQDPRSVECCRAVRVADAGTRVSPAGLWWIGGVRGDPLPDRERRRAPRAGRDRSRRRGRPAPWRRGAVGVGGACLDVRVGGGLTRRRGGVGVSRSRHIASGRGSHVSRHGSCPLQSLRCQRSQW